MLTTTYELKDGMERELRRIHKDEVEKLINDGDVIVKGSFYPNSISVALTCAADASIKRKALALVPSPKSLIFEKNKGNKAELGKFLRSFGTWSEETVQEELDFLFAVPV